MNKKRSIGVILCGVTYLAIGGFFLIIFLPSIRTSYPSNLFFITPPVLTFIAGSGILLLRPWARKLALYVVFPISTVYFIFVLQILSAPYKVTGHTPGPTNFIFPVLLYALYVGSIIILNLSKVKGQFKQ